MSDTTLDNGIRVLSEHIPGVRSASVGAWIRHGTAHEHLDDHGASHLLEHMVFKGTRRRTAQEIAVALEGLGGSLDAYTSREHTSYQARVLDEHLPEALDVVSDLVLEPRLDATDLALEREVVLEEIAQVEDTPDDLVFDVHAASLWQDHPYGRPILGTRESVTALSADRLRAIHQRGYVGANIVVAGAGNIDHREFVDRVERHFGALRAGEPTAPLDKAPTTSDGVVRMPRDSAQTHIVFGSLGPEHASADRFPVVLLSSALGGGMSSRLFQRVREELGLCYSVFSFQSFYRHAGMVGVYVGTRPATADAASEAIRAELARVAEDGLPDDEFERTKNQMKGQITLSLESTGARLYRLASFALYEEPFMGLDDLLARIDAVTREDVARVAARYYAPGSQLEVRLGPA